MRTSDAKTESARPLRNSAFPIGFTILLFGALPILAHLPELANERIALIVLPFSHFLPLLALLPVYTAN